MNILVVDVGGTNVKVACVGRIRGKTLKIPSGSAMTPQRMTAAVLGAIGGWRYEAVSIGMPGPVRNGKPVGEPRNLGKGWVRFNYRRAFRAPVRILNDASMQALGSYRGGRMLFLGLGTGLGSALALPGVIVPLELAHLPYRKDRTFEDYLGTRGMQRLGRAKWTQHVAEVTAMLRFALQADTVTIGGGNAKKLLAAPPGTRLSDNRQAIEGGVRIWSRDILKGERPRVGRAKEKGR